jgi:hypothetical protein
MGKRFHEASVVESSEWYTPLVIFDAASSPLGHVPDLVEGAS